MAESGDTMITGLMTELVDKLKERPESEQKRTAINKLFRILTYKKTVDQNGRVSHFYTEKTRSTNTKADIPRFLRYISRLLYHKIRETDGQDKLEPVEVQIMRIDKKDGELYRYVIAHNNQSKENSDKMFKRVKSFCDHDLKPWPVDAFRDRRKLEKAVLFLQHHSEMVNNFKKHYEFCQCYGSEDDSRHAEEFLCKEIENLRKEDFVFYIYGIKRPCITCFVRMEKLGIENVDKENFNRHYGRLFLHAAENQAPEEQFETLKLLITGQSFISQNKNTDADTDSDSDSESLNEQASLLTVSDKQ